MKIKTLSRIWRKKFSKSKEETHKQPTNHPNKSMNGEQNVWQKEANEMNRFCYGGEKRIKRKNKRLSSCSSVVSSSSKIETELLKWNESTALKIILNEWFHVRYRYHFGLLLSLLSVIPLIFSTFFTTIHSPAIAQININNGQKWVKCNKTVNEKHSKSKRRATVRSNQFWNQV